MKLKTMIDDLNAILEEHGDIECAIQNDPTLKTEKVESNLSIFMVVEEYKDGKQCSIRTWPY